jgi:hypothetical protein
MLFRRRHFIGLFEAEVIWNFLYNLSFELRLNLKFSTVL